MYMKRYLQSNQSFLSNVKRKIIGFTPRKFHCFALGAEKTGTTSIHRMFNNNYRSGHEPEIQKTCQLAIDYLEGKITRAEVTDILKRRDKLLHLEMESMHVLVYLSEILVETFPDAKFIITVREPYSHLDSILNWRLMNYFKNSPWENYLTYFFKSINGSFEPEEMFLQKLNLLPINTYLQKFAEHYKHVVKNIPPHRRIIIKTGQLSNSQRYIASFLNIDETSLQVTHANKNKKKVKLLDQLDQKFVHDRIWHYCSDIVTEYFPETIENYKLDGHRR